MSDHDTELRRQLAEVNARLARHERRAARVMAAVIVVAAVVLALLVGVLVEWPAPTRNP